jgi:hypothetical protein
VISSGRPVAIGLDWAKPCTCTLERGISLTLFVGKFGAQKRQIQLNHVSSFRPKLLKLLSSHFFDFLIMTVTPHPNACFKVDQKVD